MSATTGRSAWLAAALSCLAPGLGQLYNRETSKGIATLCITIGTWIILAWSLMPPARPGAWLSVVLLGVIYVFIWIPAIIDAYRRASGAPSPWLSGQSVWYIVVMLLTVGPMALPLLWQSPALSRTAKIIWTVTVILIALLVIGAIAVIGPMLENAYRMGADVQSP